MIGNIPLIKISNHTITRLILGLRFQSNSGRWNPLFRADSMLAPSQWETSSPIGLAQTSNEPWLLIKAHTHTHTHTHIYIYIYKVYIERGTLNIRWPTYVIMMGADVLVPYRQHAINNFHADLIETTAWNGHFYSTQIVIQALNKPYQHIETEIKSPPFPRRHFKCIFLNENV